MTGLDMSDWLQVTARNGIITFEFSIPALHGEFSIKEQAPFVHPAMQCLTESLNPKDPRCLGLAGSESLKKLRLAHEGVGRLLPETDEWNDSNKKAFIEAFWAADVLVAFFSQYELKRPIWGCEKAWLNLLRLRYFAIAMLHETLSASELPEEAENYLALARVDWREFCMDPGNHHLFGEPEKKKERSDRGGKAPADAGAAGTGQFEAKDVESEVKAILYRPNKKAPYRYYLDEPRGQIPYDRLTSDWFLGDRYDLIGAINLAKHRVGSWLCHWVDRVGSVTVLLSALAAALVLVALVDGLLDLPKVTFGPMQGWLLAIYAVLAGIFAVGVRWKIPYDLALPRVWAAMMAGYLPLVTSGGLWKVPYRGLGGVPVPWYALLVWWVIALALTFFFLRGQIATALGPSATKRSRWLPAKRAVVMLVASAIISLISGLIFLDIAGEHLVSAYFDSSRAPVPSGTQGLLGTVYWPVLSLFAPMALLIGVGLRMFWEEKTITHPA